jgi:hypothetical protein
MRQPTSREEREGIGSTSAAPSRLREGRALRPGEGGIGEGSLCGRPTTSGSILFGRRFADS